MPSVPTLDHFLRHHARHSPHKVFWRQVSGAGVSETDFQTFAAQAHAFASGYAALGVAPGQVVLIFLPQGVAGVAAFFGAILAGVVPSFMPCPSAKQHPSVYWPAHAALIARIAPQLLVTDAAHAEQMRAHGIAGAAGILVTDTMPQDAPALPASPADPDATAFLQHSSGTTSLKKGVALSHRAVLRQVAAYADSLGLTHADNVVSWLPVYHDMGLMACTVMPMILGQTVTCLSPFEWVARPALLFEAIARYQGHVCWLPNFAFEHLARAVPDDEGSDLSGMRAFINCSEPCKAETFARFATRFAAQGVRADQLQVCYAMAETVFAVSQTPLGTPARTLDVDATALYTDGRAVAASPGKAAIRLLSAGAPIEDISVSIEEAGVRLADGQVGEIVLSGAFLFDGYYKDAGTTAERLRDGRYATRDRGFLLDGALYVLGRKDDLLIINGRNLHAHEVEAIAAGVPGLKAGRAAAFGAFNAAVGSEELIVVAERDPDSPPGGTGRLARQMRAAIYQQTNIEVKACRVVEPGWLVKTTSGKVSRQANAAKYAAELAGAAGALREDDPPDLPVADRVARLIARTFGVPWQDILPETTADDVEGWDSLSHASLILDIERAFAVRFGDAEIFSFATVGALSARTAALVAAGPVEAAEDRVVHKSPGLTILRLGAGSAPDVIIFAGRERVPGDMDMMSFSSTFAGFNDDHATKYFVTDKVGDWYVSCFDDMVATLDRVSGDRAKILFGNSMGGYAALRCAGVLRNVTAVLALVPQQTAAVRKQRDQFRVQLKEGVSYCLLFGTSGDFAHRRFFHQAARHHSKTDIIELPNCGHNLVRYVNRLGILPAIVRTTLDPQTMAANIRAIVGGLQPEWHRPAWLRQRFGRANITADGRLTREQAHGRLAVVDRNFATLDPQQRGYVTLDEIIAARMDLT